MAEGIMPPERPIVTRVEAKVLGLKRYFTGKPCGRGHVGERNFSGKCVECDRLTSAEYYLKNSDKIKAAALRWHCENPEKAKSASRKWRKKNPDSVRTSSARWKEKHPEKVKAARAARYHKDPEAARAAIILWRQRNPSYVAPGNARWRETYRLDLLEYQKEWRTKNADYKREMDAKWRCENPEKRQASHAARRAAKKSAVGRYTAADIRKLLKIQRGCCAYCRASIKSRYHVDHIIPLSRGGSNWPSNIQITCVKCNLSKGAKHPAEFARARGLLL